MAMATVVERRHVARGASRGPVGVLVIGLALGGCSQGEDEVCLEDLEGVQDKGASTKGIGAQGVQLQGVQLQGTSFNEMQNQGTTLNGVSMQGISMQGTNLNGLGLNGLHLEGSQLVGVASDGRVVAGTDLVGATMSGQLSDGATLPLRVDAAATLDGSNSDVWAYAVSYRTDEGWSALCGTSDGAPILAIPLAGTWNDVSGVPGGGSWNRTSELFTLGCRGAALGKCVELGYAPWKTAGGVRLRDHHQACTRMLRADYCGDGTSWTRDGTLINLHDAVGVQADEASWSIDAEWTPDGAICADNIRDFQAGSPSCLERLEARECGGFSAGALLIDEYEKSCAAE